MDRCPNRKYARKFLTKPATSGYGSDPKLLHSLDGDREVFIAEVHCNQRIWTEAPWPNRQSVRGNAPADEDPRVLIGDGLGRNVLERNFQDGKSEVVMADYQTRGWLAWHHHMSLVMLALLFLMQERMHSPAPVTEEGLMPGTAGRQFSALDLSPNRTKTIKHCTELRAWHMLAELSNIPLGRNLFRKTPKPNSMRHQTFK